MIEPLSHIIHPNSQQPIYVQKRAIVTCTRIYPHTLVWSNQRRNDRDAEKNWRMVEQLKTRIIGLVESPNEGYVKL